MNNIHIHSCISRAHNVDHATHRLFLNPGYKLSASVLSIISRWCYIHGAMYTSFASYDFFFIIFFWSQRWRVFRWKVILHASMEWTDRCDHEYSFRRIIIYIENFEMKLCSRNEISSDNYCSMLQWHSIYW